MSRCRLLAVAWLLTAATTHAEPVRSELDAVKEQLQQFQQQILKLQDRIKTLEAAKAEPAEAPAPAPPPAPAMPSWSPAQPIPLLRAGTAYLNIGFDAMVNFGWSTAQTGEIRTGHHAPFERGFSVRSVELALDGAVDPYFKGVCNLALALDHDGGTTLELEEAYAMTTALPWSLQAKAGQMYAAFGRQNSQHAHEWAFVDQPLVLSRLFGGDGLRNPGAQLSWLAPTPFYSELILGVFNSNAESFRGGGHAHDDHEGEHEEGSPLHGGEPVDRNLRGPQDLLFVPRVAAAFDLGDTQTLLVGASAAFGPNNSGPDADTQVYGVDLYWKWRPLDAEAGFPFVSWQNEALLRRYAAATRETHDEEMLPGETLSDWGFYSQALWGFTSGWVAGLRGEFVTSDTAAFDSELRLDRTRISPNLNWYPTEYSKLRMQYNYDHRQRYGEDHSVWMQLEFLLGAHAAHKF